MLKIGRNETRDRLRPRLVAIREELREIVRIAKLLSIKLNAVKTANPEHGKGAVIRPSEGEPKKRPR